MVTKDVPRPRDDYDGLFQALALNQSSDGGRSETCASIEGHSFSYVHT